MRLLKSGPFVSGDPATLELHEFRDRKEPRYAALSHLWAEAQDEVLFADLLPHCDPAVKLREGHLAVDLSQEPAASLRQKPGWPKLAFALEQAYEDGKDWLWLDTACIDRSSSAELTEAINSLYHWYQESAICYAFLPDLPLEDWRDAVHSDQSPLQSRWFSRAWTLPELIAPGHLVFYSQEWTRLGDKHQLRHLLSLATGIEPAILDGSRNVEETSIARRMSWAAHRDCALPEDRAYSLVGLFGVNMSPLYGEGEKKAFLRLQEQIMKNSEDHSIFAWSDPQVGDQLHGLLADSPRAFAHSGDFEPYAFEDQYPFEMSNRGVRISLHLTPDNENGFMAALQCPNAYPGSGYLAVYLRKLPSGDRQYARVHCDEITSLDTLGRPEQIYIRQSIPPLGVFPSMRSLHHGMHTSNYSPVSRDSTYSHVVDPISQRPISPPPKSPNRSSPPPERPDSGKMFPIHLFHISKFRTWGGYQVLDVHFQPPKFSLKDRIYADLRKELTYPPNVPDELLLTFKMVQESHRITAAILVGLPDAGESPAAPPATRNHVSNNNNNNNNNNTTATTNGISSRSDDSCVAILLGTSASNSPGFDIVECSSLRDLKTCGRSFEPMDFGTMAFGKHHRVTVRAEPVEYDKAGVKVWQIELGVGGLGKTGIRDSANASLDVARGDLHLGGLKRQDSQRSSMSRMSWIVQRVARRTSDGSR
ncbi:Hypothetical predicted protein [Lecanosticta acicola]|uniref:Heterokaryon incompatibility domain-containing protein n=1 Tax=Lecanosticta acicola TaxID=111012 RepID=A0AAI8YY17_9PEZI|nr:Hypothetical predicted protein [Lecanosticta acicola]